MDGFTIAMEDIGSSQLWNLRYRFRLIPIIAPSSPPRQNQVAETTLVSLPMALLFYLIAGYINLWIFAIVFLT
ncbi:hypothetical protein L1987_71265 [Smallanthus sonchifolius]|uniref:Uncharacterized protein n=1 Tax=Smallanthus sonchifolius TaxID=185202 RepID=A0ACB9AR58_9ASTR|nr:hypothetical protein L1987_71265 [Smallanthus sonchifolius]